MLRAIIINIIPPESDRSQAEKECQELVNLIRTLRGIVVVQILQKRGRPSASTFLGTGKAAEVARLVRDLQIDVVVANDMLKPTQLNNLTKIIPCAVWDRVDVILRIFERNAQTQESKWQIELARLKHEFPRLYGRGIEMSQIVGGKKGYTRGPGEKMLETMKRHLRRKIEVLEKKVAQMQTVHATQREVRRRNNFLNIALVGYTNSGKSSLLVALTRKKNILIADKLFSTLDTRIGSMYLPQVKRKILLSDTIGFIQNLPSHLISSFLSTLEESREADLLLHVVDISEDHPERRIAVVQEILKQLGSEDKPTLYVFNKADVVSREQRKIMEQQFEKFRPIFISAKAGQGLAELRIAIQKSL